MNENTFLKIIIKACVAVKTQMWMYWPRFYRSTLIENVVAYSEIADEVHSEITSDLQIRKCTMQFIATKVLIMFRVDYSDSKNDI